MRRSRAKSDVRAQEVYRLLVCGASYQNIVDYCREHWNLSSERSADRLIGKARELLEKDAETVRPVELGKAIARMDEQYRKSDEEGDRRNAILAETKRIELLGLAAPKVTEVSGRDGGPIQHEHAVDYSQLSDEELEAAIVREAEAITGRAGPAPESVVDSRTDGEAEGVS